MWQRNMGSLQVAALPWVGFGISHPWKSKHAQVFNPPHPPLPQHHDIP